MSIPILVLSLIAGIVGTGVGGILGVLFKRKGDKIMSKILSFAGGVMVGIVVFEMLPESLSASKTAINNQYGIFITLASVIVGMVSIFGLNKLLDHLEKYQVKVSSSNLKAEESSSKKTQTLMKSGIVMLLAIALHNIPEGMAIGASGAVELKTGILVSSLIALHNIPEGMAISAPLASGGMKAWKTILLTSLAGAATVLGALIGFLVGGVGELAIGICMGLAGGAMLYVTICEIFPQSILMDGGRVPAISMLVGILGAMISVYLL